MDGLQYENACAEYLKKHGFYNVVVTKASGDQGVDVIAEKAGHKYGIQCKYYTGAVGNKAVQEAYSGAAYYNCDKAVVMTNSTFTKSAIELAKKLGVELWDKQDERYSGSKTAPSISKGPFDIFYGLTFLVGMIYAALFAIVLALSFFLGADRKTIAELVAMVLMGLTFTVSSTLLGAIGTIVFAFVAAILEIAQNGVPAHDMVVLIIWGVPLVVAILYLITWRKRKEKEFSVVQGQTTVVAEESPKQIGNIKESIDDKEEQVVTSKKQQDKHWVDEIEEVNAMMDDDII